MKKISIATRITLWYAVFLIAVSVVLMVVLLQYYDFREKTTAESQLKKTVESVDDRIASDGEDFTEDPDIDYYMKDTYMSVYTSDGRFIAGIRPEGIKDFPAFSPDNTYTFDDEQGRQWYVYDNIIYMDDNKELYIRGMMENTGYESTRLRLGSFIIIAIPALLILALAGGWLISSSAMKPIQNLISVTNEIREDGDLSKRVPVPPGGDETSELAESINGMFDSIEEVVNREKQFTSDVSHELRTPITIIRTQSEYAMEDPSYMRKALATINRESQRMGNLIINLLTISRSESGRLHPDMKPIDIRTLLEDIADQAKVAAADRDIDIEFIDRTAGKDINIRSDEDLLMRIVLNLLDNAIYYGKSPGGRVEMRLAKNGDFVVITVADDGEGIPAEEQSKVWNRFYQTDASRSEHGSGGLGLAMVESLTKTLGGSIRIVPDEERRPGELPGAVFELRLPLKQFQ